MPDASYQALIQRVKEIGATQSIQQLLEWDQQTCMPKKGTDHRATQFGLIAGIVHRLLTSDELGTLLEKAEHERDADDPTVTTNLRETRRDYDRARKLPDTLVRDTAEASALAFEAWQAARQESDFSRFAPHLERLLDLKRDAADKLGWEGEPYDALMDEFEPGTRAADVATIFSSLEPALRELIGAIQQAPRQPDVGLLQRPAPIAKQADFNRTIANAMGFDFTAGRLDVSTHPFTLSLSPLDVRMTTRYDEHSLSESLFGVMHETGHALYEQGYAHEHTWTPMGTYVSLGIHESQSRLWENMVGRSRSFWQYAFPKLQTEFPAWANVPLDDWYFAINAVEPSLIRVRADEVTYGLHIMLRFELERDMVAGRIAVKDIPAAWNDRIKQMLGVTPPDDAQGCLQDMHWSAGAFGYFPSYQLGNLYAAHFFAAARQALPELDDQIARGELLPLREWLRENIHQHGRRYRSAELLKEVTGEDLSHRPFIDYLQAKLGPLYGV